MYRKSLALLATGLILFAALLVQMSIAQAAAPGQTTPDALPRSRNHCRSRCAFALTRPSR